MQAKWINPRHQLSSPFDLATLIPNGDATDRQESASSPSSALQALADVALDDVQPGPLGLDLTLSGGTDVEGDTLAILPMPPPSPLCPETPEAVAPRPVIDADVQLPCLLRESPSLAASAIHMPAVPTVLGATAGYSPTGADLSPVAAPAPDQPIFFGEDFDLPAWIDGGGVEPQSPVFGRRLSL